jgi:RecA-family ATPase
MSAPKNSCHNLQIALKWQQAGLSVFVAGPDKKPRVKWRDVSTTDSDQIEKWFKQWPDALPAIDLAKSGHIILDGDRHGGPDGVAAAEQLFAERSLNAAAIPTVITPQDGRHYWFMQPTEGEPLGNSDKPIRDKGINVRGEGGYVIAPGTRLPDGREYKRDPSTPSALEAVQTGTVPVLPPAIEKLLRANGGHSAAQMPPHNGTTYSPTSSREESYARAALNSIAHKIASTPPNTGRNNELNNGALTMGHMVAAGWIGRSTVEGRLFDAATTCGLVNDDGQRSVLATIKSGLDAGEKEPHAPLRDREECRAPNHSADAKPSDGNEEKKSETLLPLPFISMANWDDEPLPDREWAVPNRIPLRQPVILSGEGGAGKSNTALHLCCAHSLGRDWLGSMPEPGAAIFLDAEDDEKELHLRTAAITRHYGVTFDDLIKGGLHLLSFAGKDVVLATVARSGKVEPTPLYKQILEAAGDIKPKMFGIASSANVFAGNENERAQVQQFVGLLTRIAVVANGSVQLISHPSLTGISTDTGLSGTTQWHNAVRARSYMKSIKPEAGEQPNSDLRELVFKKNQYGPISETIVLRYKNGLFLPVPGMNNLDKAAREAKAEEVFLALLRRFARENRIASDKPGTSYAPALFAKEDEAIKAGLSSKNLAAAMRELFKAEKIWNEPYGRPSRPSYRIIVKERGV